MQPDATQRTERPGAERDAEERKERQTLSKARFKLRDVIHTTDPVSVHSQRGRDGSADPGWEWRIVEVYAEYGSRLRYKVVAHSAPKMYHAILRDSQISHKVGRHDEPLPLDGEKVKPTSAKTNSPTAAAKPQAKKNRPSPPQAELSHA